MKNFIDMKSFWFKPDGIVKVENMYGAKHMGYWCKKHKIGWWTDYPVDVFYQPTPDLAKGHTHYFGLFLDQGNVMITDADSAFSEPMTGIEDPETGEVLVSRYRHDSITRNSLMIDGGRDYLRYSGPQSQLVTVTVKDGNFIFEKAFQTGELA